MIKQFTAAIVTGALAVFLVPAAGAQQINCAPRDVVAAALAKKYGESPTLRGMVGNALLEVWLDNDSGSFSIILTQASSGLACIMGAGTSMHHVLAPKPGEKS